MFDKDDSTETCNEGNGNSAFSCVHLEQKLPREDARMKARRGKSLIYAHLFRMAIFVNNILFSMIIGRFRVATTFSWKQIDKI